MAENITKNKGNQMGQAAPKIFLKDRGSTVFFKLHLNPNKKEYLRRLLPCSKFEWDHCHFKRINENTLLIPFDKKSFQQIKMKKNGFDI